MTIEGEFLPENAQVALPAELFVVVRLTLESGASAWFYKDPDGNFRRWNGSIPALEPAHTLSEMRDTVRIVVYEGPLLPASYAVFLGFISEGDALVYTGSPLKFEVDEQGR